MSTISRIDKCVRGLKSEVVGRGSASDLKIELHVLGLLCLYKPGGPKCIYIFNKI